MRRWAGVVLAGNCACLVLLASCSPDTVPPEDGDDCAAPTAGYRDRDRDGFGDGHHPMEACASRDQWSAIAGDCDDTDAGIHPSSTEQCDGRDQDCDGLIDEEAADRVVLYADSDSDGFGNPDAPAEVCPDQAGYVSDATDCDDTDATVHPAAEEIWYDGVDQDCLGDDDHDADGDGWPVGPDSDCDDDDPQTFPGAEEVCGDGVDQDCGGWTPACGITGVLHTDDADATLTGSTYAGLAGRSMATSDLNGDGQPDLVLGAPGAVGEAGGYGGVHVIPGPLASSGDVEDLSWTWSSQGDGRAGRALAAPGDLDGDGHADLVVGAHALEVDGMEQAGGVFLISGPISSAGILDQLEPAWAGTAEFQGLGGTLAAFEAMELERAAPIILAADSFDDIGESSGLVVLLEASEETLADVTYGTVLIQADQPRDQIGKSVADLGDIDGDGCADLGIGSAAWPAEEYLGAVWIVPCPQPGTATISDLGSRWETAGAGTLFGAAIAGGADLDGDGLDDLVAGAPGALTDDRGVAFVLTGSVGSGGHTDDLAHRVEGAQALDLVGTSVALGHDLDQDGAGEVLLGSPYRGAVAEDGGRLVIFYDALGGVRSIEDADAMIEGSGSGDLIGLYPARARDDLTADGVPDVLVTAIGAPGGSYRGETVLFAGGTD